MFVGFNSADSNTNEPDDHVHMVRHKEDLEYAAERDYVVLPRQQIFGEHQLPFKFTIPANVPSSYEGSYGFIEYKIDAIIDKTEYDMMGYESNQEIVIHGFYDLTTEPAVLVPVEKSEMQTYCCLCCEDGVFSFSMVLPKRGYCHGESIQPFIVLHNKTSRYAEATLKLDKKVGYVAGGSTITSDRETLVEYMVFVDPQSTRYWNTDMKITKHLTPSILTQCPNIKVDYTLKLKYEVSGCNCDQLDMELDIVIGNLPESFIAESLPVNTEPVPVMTEPQTYVYPSVDLSTPQVPGAECQPLLPPPCVKGGEPVSPPAEPTAPPITSQPCSRHPFGDDGEAPPSYAECLAMTDMSSAPGPPQPMPEHYRPYSQPECTSQEEEKKSDLS